MKKKLLRAVFSVCTAMTLVVLASCGKGGGNEGNNGDDNGGGVTPTHTHTLSPIKEQAATCVAAGNKAYHICTGDKGCGKYFWDVNGLNEITDARDVATPLAPHEYIDGVCKNCGKKKPTEGLNYSAIEEDGSVIAYSVSKGEAADPEIVIPAEHEGKPVTMIDEEAFKDYLDLTEIDIPESVTTIGANAFRGCTGLTEITVPDSVTKIQYGAFYGCKQLKEITIGKNVSMIEKYAFEGMGTTAKNIYFIGDLRKWCEIDFGETGDSFLMNTGRTLYIDGNKIEGDVVISEGTAKITDRAFYNLPITSVTIPATVRSIGIRAFWKCNELKKVIIPDSVTMIGNFAFQTCEGLTEITVGKGVTVFGNQAFGGCKNLSVIKYNGTKAQWEKITKGPSWDFNVGLTTNRSYTIICTDETILVEDEW